VYCNICLKKNTIGPAPVDDSVSSVFDPSTPRPMSEIERMRNEIKELQRKIQLAESNGLGALHAGDFSHPAQSDAQGVSLEGDFLTPHTSNLKPHTSHLKPQTSNLKPQTSHLTPHTSHLTPHTSNQSERRLKSWMCLPTMESPLTSHHHTFFRRRHNRRLQLWRCRPPTAFQIQHQKSLKN
jgi:hypothetical protein